MSDDDHDDCSYCTGEACRLCGAGCWSDVDDCEHDTAERHGLERCIYDND